MKKSDDTNRAQPLTKLFLDDVRNPPDTSWIVVRSYLEFTEYIDKNGCPDVVSFDHDLAFEHSPFAEENPHPTIIPYEKYKEKTGLHAARYLIEKGLRPKYWACHSQNPAGKQNIREEMSRFCPGREFILVR